MHGSGNLALSPLDSRWKRPEFLLQAEVLFLLIVNSIDLEQRAARGNLSFSRGMPEEAQDAAFRGCARRLLASTFFSSWGDRMWQFSVVIFLLELFPGTLVYTAIYGIALNLMGFLLGPSVGALIDKNERITLIRGTLLVENSSSVITCILYLVALQSQAYRLKQALFAIIVLLATAGDIASSAASISISKDWVPKIVASFFGKQGSIQGKIPQKKLAELNASLMRLDLISKICSPIPVGLISSFLGVQAAIVFVGAWNFFTFFVEYFLVKAVYDRVEILQVPKTLFENSGRKSEHQELSLGRQILYFIRIPIFPACLSFSLLYFNLLTEGNLSTTFLRWMNVSDFNLSLYRGAAALFGVFSTYITPLLIKRINLNPTTLIGSWTLVLSLSACLLAFSIPRFHEISSLESGAGSGQYFEQPLSRSGLVLFICGIVFSRLGLWCFDLGFTQILQNNVPSDRIGLVNGFISSTNSFLFMLSNILVLVFNDPKQFGWPTVICFCVIFSSALLFTLYVFLFSVKKQRVISFRLLNNSSDSEEDSESEEFGISEDEIEPDNSP